MVDAQTVGVLVTAASVTVAAVYYILTLRVQQRNMSTTLDTREAQLFMTVYNHYVTREFLDAYYTVLNWKWTDYEDLIQKYGPTNPHSWVSLGLVVNYFEGVGILVKRGLLDISLVDDFTSGPLRSFWEDNEAWIREFRVKQNWPHFCEWVEYLYDEVEPIVESQHPEIVGKRTLGIGHVSEPQ
jgi:hypothetical protein